MWQGQSPAPYRCLSYMWGAPFAHHEILINGGRFRVGDNLHRFLHTARRLYPSQPLWIDAICINQRDLAEKGHQVQAMGHIYRKAKEVLIWLG
ncbi:heterokaryon incompatibility, partial [Corynespora cassiicola Philippines]